MQLIAFGNSPRRIQVLDVHDVVACRFSTLPSSAEISLFLPNTSPEPGTLQAWNRYLAILSDIGSPLGFIFNQLRFLTTPAATQVFYTYNRSSSDIFATHRHVSLQSPVQTFCTHSDAPYTAPALNLQTAFPSFPFEPSVSPLDVFTAHHQLQLCLQALVFGACLSATPYTLSKRDLTAAV